MVFFGIFEESDKQITPDEKYTEVNTLLMIVKKKHYFSSEGN